MKFKMAGVNSQRVRTRSCKTAYPAGDTSEAFPSETPSDENVTPSFETTSSVFGKGDNGVLSKMELRVSLKNKEAVARSKRKRRRIDSEDEDEEEEGTKTIKKTRAAVEKTKTKKQAPSKERELRAKTKKVVYTEKKAKESSDEAESPSEKESGMASSYISSSPPSLSDRDSDSPVATSELSDTSFDIDSSSYESSGNEDISWRIRKSPRKKAQADSRKKIAELRAKNSDSEDSTTSSESSYISE